MVNEVFTNWDYNGRGFWSSQDGKINGIAQRGDASPSDSHEVIGYRVGTWSNNPTGTIYSTGVADELLEKKLIDYGILNEGQLADPNFYKKKTFKAYSTNGVQGNIDTGSNYLLAGDLMDKHPVTGVSLVGNAEQATDNDLSSLNAIYGLTIFDVIIDGKNGLDLGTGISNFNKKTDIQFFSGNGQPGAIGDQGTPDLLITQIADAGKNANQFDLYFYADNAGNIIGRPIKLFIDHFNDKTKLAWWKLDLYSFPGGTFATAKPNKRAFTNAAPDFRDQVRPMWMAAFQLEDFGIDNGSDQTNVEKIENINMMAGGTADIAFLAYNQAAFKIKSPVAKPLLSKYICKPDGTSSVTFELIEGENVGIEDDFVVGQINFPGPGEELSFLWMKNNIPIPGETNLTLTVNNIDESQLGTYKVKIWNSKGTIIIPVSIYKGGTPYTWDGSTWSSAYGTVEEKKRNLIFAADYNQDSNALDENKDLKGCDCNVAVDVDVTIPDGKTMTLYGKITIAPEIIGVPGEIDGRPAGTFTLKNNASLIQTNDVTINENRGNIIVERIAEGLKKYDYVYWSSPVADSEVKDLPGTRKYIWDVTAGNIKGTTGDWKIASGKMVTGKGYIARVTDPVVGTDPEINYTRTHYFQGVPQNGDYSIEVIKSPSPVPVGNENLNLIGNPYPSAMSADKFLAINTFLEDGIQIWTHATAISTSPGNSPFYQNFKFNYSDENYLTYNGTASTVPDFDGYIASGQGFFVKTTLDNVPVQFTNAMRFGVDYTNKQFFRETSESQSESNDPKEKQLIWLALIDESKIGTVGVVGYAPGATNGKDRLYDAGSGPGTMRIYSRIDDEDFLIQGRALPFDENDQVPLGIEVLKNGIYNIGIDHLKGSQMLNQDQGIYLEDTYNNVIHNLRASPYGFTATQGDIKDRFVLRYTDQQLSVEDQQMKDTFVYIKNNQLYVKAAQHIQSIEVYDLSGKRLLNHILDGHTDRFNAPFQFSKGAYLAIINLQDSGRVTKKVLN